ncbi:MAG: hypothetical protein DRR08_28690 [Candidatus Parabeggiatoa sp. nov. 2]|nr:MAG: hypothetical protein B6247_27115 [Beggiatoa sp. 4572_84]RKZ52095.1 MAG: hypothetical protein DRR08_28690 [Gammaproteobacteria bacterium]
MKVKTLSEQEVFYEAMTILLKNMSTAKMARFLSILYKDSRDSLTLREQLFEGETVETLYNKIHDFQSKERA